MIFLTVSLQQNHLGAPMRQNNLGKMTLGLFLITLLSLELVWFGFLSYDWVLVLWLGSCLMIWILVL